MIYSQELKAFIGGLLLGILVLFLLLAIFIYSFLHTAYISTDTFQISNEDPGIFTTSSQLKTI